MKVGTLEEEGEGEAWRPLRLRRSKRDTQAIRFGSFEILFYKKLHDLFFVQPSNTELRSIGRGRWEIEQEHRSPNIYVIRSFLTETTIHALRNLANQLTFERSFVEDGNGQPIVDASRTSTVHIFDKVRPVFV